MPIFHKFFQTNWNNGFETHNAILDITPYKPEVMFVGTFNPAIPGNAADFFYGRNYFWPALKNLFIPDDFNINQRRDRTLPTSPTLYEIFELCWRLKLTFADLIQSVLYNNNPVYDLLPRNRVHYDARDISLIEDNGLALLSGTGQVDWNTKNIIKYLCNNPQIKTIYFTRQPTGIWASHWNAIKNHNCMVGRNFTNIYTPSGRRLRTPVMNNLLNRWVHNNNPNFYKLDNNWLTNNNVNINNF
jgi:hypothetical protein